MHRISLGSLHIYRSVTLNEIKISQKEKYRLVIGVNNINKTQSIIKKSFTFERITKSR